MIEEKKPYKINIGEVYKIKRKDINKNGNNYTFFSINVTKKNKNGDTVNGNKNVRLVNSENIQDGQSIKILDMFEDFYIKDYTTIFTLVITKYEVIDIEEPTNVYADALSEYEKELGGALGEW